MKKTIDYFIFASFLLISINVQASLSSKFRIYFNRPVNNAVSSGTNAISIGGHTIDTLINYINLAQYSIDIAQYDYIQSSDFANIAAAVNNAYSRGVTVRWVCDGSSSNSGLSALNAGIHTLASPTGASYGIMHNKFMIVDANASDSAKSWVYTGSMDWSSEQVDSDYNNIVIIQSQQLAKAYTAQFNQMWGGTGATPVTANEKFGPFKTDLGPHIFYIDGIKVELYFSPTDSTNDHIIDAINSANEQLFFGVYTFTETSDATAINAQFNAGVHTYGIVDQYSISYSAYSTMSPVLGNNLKVYAQSNSIYHNKYMIADACDVSSDPQVLTGSHNWSSSANTLNDENTLIIHDATIANIYYQAFNSDFAALGGSITGCNVSTVNCNNAISENMQTNNEALCYDGATAKATVHATGNGGPFTYSWSSSPAQTDSVLNNVAAGTYTVTITDQNFCSTTASVTLSQAAQIIISLMPKNATCYGGSNGTDSVSATGGTGSYSYQWANNQSASYISNLSAGPYDITVTDGNQCTATATSSVGQGAEIIISPTVNNASCDSSNGSVSVSVADMETPYTYAWSGSLGSDSTISNLASGNYTVTVNDHAGCSASISINVGATGDSVSFTVNTDTLTAQGASSYQWLLNGQPITGATSEIYVAAGTGNYSVKGTSNNCSATSATQYVMVSSINEICNEKISIYPNPTADYWQVNLGHNMTGSSVEIFDDNGRLVYKSQITNSNFQVRANLPGGVYFMRITSGLRSINLKLVKL